MHAGDILLDDRPSTALLIAAPALLAAILLLVFISMMDVGSYIVANWCQ